MLQLNFMSNIWANCELSCGTSCTIHSMHSSLPVSSYDAIIKFGHTLSNYINKSVKLVETSHGKHTSAGVSFCNSSQAAWLY